MDTERGSYVVPPGYVAAEADAALMDGHVSCIDLFRDLLEAAEADAALMDGHSSPRVLRLTLDMPRRPTRP